MTRPLRRGLGLALLVLCCSAHIGSPDAWYQGPAGPYDVLIRVQPPLVVPGIAAVEVMPAHAGVTRITAVINRFDAGATPPPPDVALPLRDRPGWYGTRLWVMTTGSNSVTVTLEGTAGSGSVVVPLSAVAGRRLGFARGLAGLLLAAGLVLAAGWFTIIGAAVRESVLPPGEEPDATRRRRARWVMLRSVLVLGAVLTAWTLWWRAEDRRFARGLYRPLALRAGIDTTAGISRLTLTITDSAWIHRHDAAWQRGRRPRDASELVEDHGKLMHLFLVAEGTRSAFAHLHPGSTDMVTFVATLPPLPPGRYAAFADVVHASGFTETLTATLQLDSALTRRVAATPTDPDDSWWTGEPARALSARLEDGSRLEWLRPAAPLIAGEEAGLRFVLRSSEPKAPELYLGMAGHAAVVRDDDSVFIHLHPLGTISLAAQTQLLARLPAGRGHSMGPRGPADTLSFPYAFSRPGNYTVWVQLRRGGRILTAGFPATVETGAGR